jgi:hypothetical protein
MQEISKVNSVFSEYSIKAFCLDFKKINNFNVYDIELLPGCKIKAVEAIANEMKLRLKFKNKPIFFISDGIIKMIFSDEPSKILLSGILNNIDGMNIVLGIDHQGEIVKN